MGLWLFSGKTKVKYGWHQSQAQAQHRHRHAQHPCISWVALGSAQEDRPAKQKCIGIVEMLTSLSAHSLHRLSCDCCSVDLSTLSVCIVLQCQSGNRKAVPEGAAIHLQDDVCEVRASCQDPPLLVRGALAPCPAQAG